MSLSYSDALSAQILVGRFREPPPEAPCFLRANPRPATMLGLNPVSASGLRQCRRNEGLVCGSENPLLLRLHRSDGVVYLEQTRVQCLNSGQHRGSCGRGTPPPVAAVSSLFDVGQVEKIGLVCDESYADLRGRQGADGGEAEYWWWLVHSRGELDIPLPDAEPSKI